MRYETVLTERRGETGGILWVTLNRPEKLNALSMTLFDDLRQVFQQARTDRSVRWDFWRDAWTPPFEEPWCWGWRDRRSCPLDTAGHENVTGGGTRAAR
jgi:hypothetical protein